eukprot:CAMPEP_0185024748 /NCGR_PEP_ID=MMETSP1103-20130426/7944_1 /TAXON_ID=36769 /ORGANISM="Paraphysomonas bandaiensis, Strain Caron Lab Isolate" /LENGTH=215 /DNA_ID=CAMNT_0027557801 /DNA_START=45 /DNA_END=692 /DNA_ORIENTATION=-
MDSAMHYPAFDLNGAIDFVVPFYMIGVVTVIVMFNMYSKRQVRENYVLKKAATKSNTPQSWKEQMNGYWNQCEEENFDGWLKFMRKPYAIRLIAPKMFLKMNQKIILTEDKLEIIKDFGSGSTPSVLKLKVAADESSAESVEAEDEGKTFHFKAWIVEENQELHVQAIPTDNTKNIVVKHVRTMEDSDTIKMTWIGDRLDEGEQCTMVTRFTRLE